MLSEQLKRRLLSSAAGRNRKGNLSADLRQQLVTALDHLAELAALAGETPAAEGEIRAAEGATPAAVSDQSTPQPEVSTTSSSSEPKASAPAASDSAASESNASESNASEPTASELTASELIAHESTTSDPIVSDSAASDASTSDASASDPQATAVSTGPLSTQVATAVQQALEQWQQQITSSVVKALASQHRSCDEMELLALVDELTEELSDTRFQLQAANSHLEACRAELKYYHEQSERESPRPFDFSLLHEDGPDLDREAADRAAADRAAELVATQVDQMQQQLEELCQQLEAATAEASDLREQNSDLAQQLAERIASEVILDRSTGRGSGEQLSWEERKLMILRQLETDTDSGSGQISEDEVADIHQMLETTNAEISRRDQEIEELREIVRMQSEARDGVAIGAAGIAQILDNDELLQQERQKLREIQEEWEAKLRQAEIDLSMERAKIARERLALEKQIEELNRNRSESQSNSECNSQTAQAGKEKNRERRWLAMLGLGEQNNDPAKD